MKQTVIPNLLWWKRRSALAITIAVLVAANLLWDKTSAATICGSRTDQAALRSLSLKTGRTLNTFIGFLGNVHTWKRAMIKPKKKCDDVCVSAGCIDAASMVLKNMDTNVDPCDNFYKFACGGFLNNTIMPDDRDRIISFTIVKDKVEEQLRASIQNKIEDNEPKPFKHVKNFYKSCMDTTAIEAQGLGPLKKKLEQLGGWPVLVGDPWNETDFDWLSTVYKLRDSGLSFNIFISFSVDADSKNSTRNVIYLGPAQFDFPRKHLLKGMDDKFVKEYHSYMVDIAVILGAKRERATIELEESLLFEMKLANISGPNEKGGNATELYNPMSISELKKQYQSIPWLEYFSSLLPSSITIDENEIAIVKVPSYLSELEKLMSNATQKRVHANYVMWRAVADMVMFLNEDIRKRELAYLTVLGTKTTRPSRRKECVDVILNSYLLISSGAIYASKYFNKEAKHSAEEMVMDIQKQFNIMLSKAEWIDNATRQNALKKSAAMSSHVGYRDELLDDNKLEEIYPKLELTGGNYFNSVFNLSFSTAEYLFSRLRKPVNKTQWINYPGPASTEAFYHSIENSIHLPAGIFQGSFYSHDRPRYMNYGAIGSVIGHEITHGFDELGRQYDKDGNLVDWWVSSSDQEFLKRAECIIHQYGNYTVQEVGLNINGTKTRDENIADLGGFKVAYLAYNKWVDRNSPEDELPGLDYTPRQMFWISAANVWCSIMRPEPLKDYINTDEHSPPEFRILGPLSNMPEFSKDFNCPIGSKMNPKNKCSIW